jgi:RimJ/RimL family protein N-acetyltransferase
VDTRVRRAGPDDMEALLDVYESVAAEGRWIGAEAPVDREETARRWREAMDAGRVAVFAAEDADGRICGTLSLMLHNGLADLGMSILDGYREQGIGSAMTRACIDWARDNGCHKISLQVWPHNERAIRLYEKFGFEREGYLRRQWKRRNGEIWDAIVMGLVLD